MGVQTEHLLATGLQPSRKPSDSQAEHLITPIEPRRRSAALLGHHTGLDPFTKQEGHVGPNHAATPDRVSRGRFAATARSAPPGFPPRKLSVTPSLSSKNRRSSAGKG